MMFTTVETAIATGDTNTSDIAAQAVLISGLTTSLNTVTADLATATAGLATVTADLATAEAGVATLQADLVLAQASLEELLSKLQLVSTFLVAQGIELPDELLEDSQ